MMRVRTVIIEDELPAREELRFLLAQYPPIEVVGMAENGREGLDVIVTSRPDLVFLDIEMPGMNGLELAQRLYGMRDLMQPRIVFITAYNEFALQAFEVEAVDYLLKPFSEERLRTTIERLTLPPKPVTPLRTAICTMEAKKIPVDYKGRYKMLPVEEIFYLTAEEGGVMAKAEKGEYPANLSLTELEKDLREYGFFRCHRSYLVNLNRVAEVIPWFKGKYLLVMDDSGRSEVPVSRTYIKELCGILKI